MKKTEKMFADEKKKKKSGEQSISQNEKTKKNAKKPVSVEKKYVTNFCLLSEEITRHSIPPAPAASSMINSFLA